MFRPLLLALVMGRMLPSCTADALIPGGGAGPGAETDEPPTESLPTPPEEGVLSDPLFDGHVVEIEVETAPNGPAAMIAAPLEWIEVEATVEGQAVGPVGLRLKGENSFLPFPDKAAFKIDFDRFGGPERWGLDGLTLNNFRSDATFVRERLAYGTFRQGGLPAARAGYAHLVIDGEDFGLYSLLDDIDGGFLDRSYDDGSGTMFELADVDFRDEYVGLFEWESGEEDRALLQAIADALDPGGEPSLIAAFDWVDRQAFIDFWAATIVVGQFDAWPYSSPGDDAHIYRNPSTGLVEFIPHGIDESLWERGRDVLAPNGRIARRCLESPACTDDVGAAVARWLEQVEEADLQTQAEDLWDALENQIEGDPKIHHDESAITAARAELRAFLGNRRGDLETRFGPLP